MDNLCQCKVLRDDFQDWLSSGTGPLAVWQGEKIIGIALKLAKNPNVDYLYMTTLGKDSSITWDNDLSFCGVYDALHKTLYLTEYTARKFSLGTEPFVKNVCDSISEEIIRKINQRVDTIINNNRNNLRVKEITNTWDLRTVDEYQKYQAKDEAIRRFFDGKAPDAQVHSKYSVLSSWEEKFMSYLHDEGKFIQTEAEQYIESNQEKLLIQFLMNDALLTAYQEIINDTDSPLHRMKAITDAVNDCGGKTVTVTIQKAGTEFTFKTGAYSLKGYQNYYSRYYLPAADRREFEQLFGRNSDYKAEDISRITYGKKVIYEVPSVPIEEPDEGMMLGGM